MKITVVIIALLLDILSIAFFSIKSLYSLGVSQNEIDNLNFDYDNYTYIVYSLNV